jgi:hypothetical protein
MKSHQSQSKTGHSKKKGGGGATRSVLNSSSSLSLYQLPYQLFYTDIFVPCALSIYKTSCPLLSASCRRGVLCEMWSDMHNNSNFI